MQQWFPGLLRPMGLVLKVAVTVCQSRRLRMFSCIYAHGYAQTKKWLRFGYSIIRQVNLVPDIFSQTSAYKSVLSKRVNLSIFHTCLPNINRIIRKKKIEITASVIDFWSLPNHCNIDYLSRDLNCMQISVWTRKRSQFPIGGSHCAVTDQAEHTIKTRPVIYQPRKC